VEAVEMQISDINVAVRTFLKVISLRCSWYFSVIVAFCLGLSSLES